MKRSLLILFAGLAAGLVAYACIYLRATSVERSMEHSSRPELAWLKTEYHLSDAQFAAVVKLHDDYRPKCAELCRRIDEQNAKVLRLLDSTNTVTPEIKEALAESARLRTECESAMLQHFYEVSRAMLPADGKRYLAWVQSETLLPGQMIPTKPAMKMQ